MGERSARSRRTRTRIRAASLAVLLGLGIALLGNGTAFAGSVWYVDDDSPGGSPGDGLGWATAFTDLQSALTVASEGDDIWVAGGTYRPDGTTGERTLSFTPKTGVALYGGFAGGETALDERDWNLNPTILSGDIGVPGDRTDNSHHVLVGADTAVIDGFTVTGGNADGAWPHSVGGGMANLDRTSPTVAHVVFSDNHADSAGGGMYNNYFSSPRLTNVVFTDNSASSGGGMYNTDSHPKLTNVVFRGNSANVGGALHNHSSSPALVNVIFSGNSAVDYGGAMYSYFSSQPSLTNVSITHNAAGAGGAVYSAGGAHSWLYDCILWDNDGGEIFNHEPTGSATIVVCSIVKGGYEGAGNLDADPLFVDAGACDLRLQHDSPAIDSGTDEGTPAFDIDGHPRPVDGDGDGDPRYDMGAYEFRVFPCLYVDAGATGAKTGANWQDAFTDLQDALAAAQVGDELWVATGAYKPTGGSDRMASFALRSGVDLYGGFLGKETDREERDWTANPTTLTGDIGTIGDATDNCYHVVVGADDALLDGFIVTAGNANGAYPHWAGGGMRNYLGAPTVVNVTFSANSAGHNGGGMYNEACSPSLIDCVFSDNSAGHGGGLYSTVSSPTVLGCVFSDNSADYGGGSYSDSSPSFTEVAFTGNDAGSGGGAYCTSGSPMFSRVTFADNVAQFGGGLYALWCSVSLTDVLFNGNVADGGGGGGMYSREGLPVLVNVSFVENSAETGGGLYSVDDATLTNALFRSNSATFAGGGMFVGGGAPTVSAATFTANCASMGGGGLYVGDGTPTLSGCILWGNMAANGPEIYVSLSAGEEMTVDHSIVQGGWAGTANLDSDPLFVDPANGDLHLQADSPAIDAGTATGAPAFDLDGVARPQDGDGDAAADFDMGAYEYEYVAPSTVDVSLAAGWNLVAGGPGTDFGSAIFGWNGSAYFSPPAVEAWQGYWCKATTATTVDMHPVAGPHTITLTTGWNLIGNPMAVAAAVAVYDAGDVLIPGRSVFVYTPGSGYATTPTLAPGQGAWVKGTAGETVVLTPTG